MKRQRSRWVWLLTASLAGLMLAGLQQGTGQADWTPPVDLPINGYKVYLSPAYHTSVAGARGECGSNTERLMAQDNVYDAAVGGSSSRGEYQNLITRGYMVRIGYSGPTTNKNSSNSWGSDLHIPVHSNGYGGSGRPGGCSTTSTTGTGARIIWVSSSGESFATKIASSLSGATPGTPDKECDINKGECTSYRCGTYPVLTELCNTSAVAAYSEVEFHDWNSGITFLHDHYNWAWRFGWAVDSYLGYPPDNIY